MYLQNKQVMDFWVKVDSIFSAWCITNTVVQVQYLSRDMWVGTTSIHGLEDRGMEFRFAAWSRFFFLSKSSLPPLFNLFLELCFRGVKWAGCKYYHVTYIASQLFEALRYKPKVCGFDSRGEIKSFLWLNLSSRSIDLVSPQPATKISNTGIYQG